MSKEFCRAWCLTPGIPTLERQRLNDCQEFPGQPGLQSETPPPFKTKKEKKEKKDIGPGAL